MYTLFDMHMWSNPEHIGGFALKLLLAMICSSLIGVEREAKHRPAGLRTHIIVCVASALIMSVGILLKEKYLRMAPNVDPSRLAAQIISGIGFLGAGTIIKGRDSVFGLTTAATLWAVACLGIAVGSGYYLEAIVATLAILIVLRVINSLEKYYQKKYSVYTVALSIDGPLENLKRLSTLLEYTDITVDYIHLLGTFECANQEFLHVELGIRNKKATYEHPFDPVSFFNNYSFVKEVNDVKYPTAFNENRR